MVGFGQLDRTKYSDTQLIPVAKIITHPQYDAQLVLNDIAIVVLAQPVPADMRRSVRPVTIPRSDTKIFAPGVMLTTAGWGKTIRKDDRSLASVLLKAQQPVMSTGDCQDIFRDMDPDMQICVSNSKHSTCQVRHSLLVP